MSIAVSAVVQPSRLLFAITASMCLVVALIGIMIAVGWVGNLSFLFRIIAVVVCIFMACWAFNRSAANRKSLHIDISGIGQIRLAEHNELAAVLADGENQSPVFGEVLQLQAASTLWSFLLLLRLQGTDQKVKILTILPDCVGVDNFRALSVACRWIATHNNSDAYKNL
ncbi:MAG: protein YgfX [Burkholderiaceae bacterium]